MWQLEFSVVKNLNRPGIPPCVECCAGTVLQAIQLEIDKAVPSQLGVHCIVDNYATHSHPKIKAWLANRPRWHMHFVPTYNSRLNQVERFFSLITDKAIHSGFFTSVKQLVQRIVQIVAAHNVHCQPFKWTVACGGRLQTSGVIKY